MTPHTHAGHHHPSTAGDRWGQLLSLVCLVHCVATPLVLTLAPALAGYLGGWHPVLLVGVAATALWAFVPGYRYHHHKGVLLLAVGGICLLAAGVLFFHESLPAETAMTIAGAAMMLGAHWKNQKLGKACPV